MDKAQNLKGFRDFLPEDMVIRQKVISTLKGVFESYGFQPLETPALEYAETLLGKTGEEAEKLFYIFNDPGGRKIGLRYDLTVPVSRVLAQYQNQIPLPFKRYQIQPAWRAENPQKGRYREFTQCDIDTFGSKSPMADAEILAVTYSCLKALGFNKFVIRINSRQVLFDILDKAGISDKEKQLSALRIIDKLDKISEDEVKKELVEKGFEPTTADQFLESIKKAKPDDNLKELMGYLKLLGVGEEFYRFDPTLVRGLDYYTGVIFETKVEEPKIGSITGGGRYDNLVESLGGPDMPATGSSFGLDRICDCIKELNLWPDLKPTETKVLVSVFSPDLLEISIKTTKILRDQEINAELYLNYEAKLDKQLQYADQKGIPYVVIIGPDEVKKNSVVVKNLKTREQKEVTLEDLPNELK